MTAFRVSIARSATKASAWDWSETVIAPSAPLALGNAYANWKNSKPSTHVPALSLCRSQVNVSGNSNLLSASAASPGQQAFVNDIQSQVAQFLATQLDGAFSMVMYPSGFNYGITYGNNGYYNQATLGDIDALLGVAANGQLDLSGGRFSTLYAQILEAVTFSFSQRDMTTMTAQDTVASAQIASVITEFTNAGGKFSDPAPFGGKLQDVFNQLVKNFGGIDKLPSTLNALRNAIAAYQSMAGDSYALHSRYNAATERVQAALANTRKPSATNGGMQTDANAYYVGFTPNKLPSAIQLISGLSTAANAVKVKVSLSEFGSASSKVRIAGGAQFSIPVADIISISVNAQASYDLSKYVSSSSEVTMDLTYPGVTLFSSAPTALSADNSSGWYANDILREVETKTGQDATGYKLQGSEYAVSELFGPGKAFSRLKTFVISQQPTITLTFTGVDSSTVISDFQVDASAKVELFGLFSLGSVAGSYFVQDVDTVSRTGAVIVTFGPPQVSGTIPLQQQVAYVLGGVAAYPPDSI